MKQKSKNISSELEEKWKKLCRELHENYVQWMDDDYFEEIFHPYNRLYPVIGIKPVTNHLGQESLKLSYYQSPPTNNLIKEEYLPASMSQEEMLIQVVNRLNSNQDYECVDSFIGQNKYFFDSPIGFFHLVRKDGVRAGNMTVRADEGMTPYQTEAGATLFTKTIFDISIPGMNLKVHHSYDFYLASGEEKGIECIETLENGSNLLCLIFQKEEWMLLLTILDPSQDTGLKSYYTVKKMENGQGFSMAILEQDCPNIWLKAAWMPMTENTIDDCKAALLYWTK